MDATAQKLLPLSSQGVTNGDFVNLAMDLKGSAVGRGVSVRLRYPTSPITEEVPTLPPVGYYNQTTLLLVKRIQDKTIHQQTMSQTHLQTRVILKFNHHQSIRMYKQHI